MQELDNIKQLTDTFIKQANTFIAKQKNIDELKGDIDEAIKVWLLANGLSGAAVNELDYSALDDELNSLLESGNNELEEGEYQLRKMGDDVLRDMREG